MQVEKIPETAADISPYATSDFQTMPLNNLSSMGGTAARVNTMGRKETMRLTDYNKHQLSQPDVGATVGRHRVSILEKVQKNI